MTASRSYALAVKVALFTDQLPIINRVIPQQNCPDIDPKLFGENQMLAEYLLVCHILKVNHPSFDIELVPYPVTQRIVDAVAKGEVDISGFGIWKNEGTDQNILLSQPLLQAGQFSKGLYALPDRAKQIKWHLGSQHPELIVVANMNWSNDWEALACSGMNRVHVGQYEQMFKMLALGRTDILTMAFGSDPQLIREEFGIELHPIQSSPPGLLYVKRLNSL